MPDPLMSMRAPEPVRRRFATLAIESGLTQGQLLEMAIPLLEARLYKEDKLPNVKDNMIWVRWKIGGGLSEAALKGFEEQVQISGPSDSFGCENREVRARVRFPAQVAVVDSKLKLLGIIAHGDQGGQIFDGGQ